MNNLIEEQAMMRLRQMRKRGRKQPRYKRISLQFKNDIITEMELRVRCVKRWLKEDMSITTIIDETGRPEWWVRDWMRAGFPLFDFPRGKQMF